MYHKPQGRARFGLVYAEHCMESLAGLYHSKRFFPAMTKRNLRVVKWLATLPVVGVCTLCSREFKVPMTAMKRVADAQESLRLQFAKHKCKGESEASLASTGA